MLYDLWDEISDPYPELIHVFSSSVLQVLSVLSQLYECNFVLVKKKYSLLESLFPFNYYLTLIII